MICAAAMPARRIAALLAVMCLLLPSSQAADSPPANPVVLLGVDGMEWSVIDDLAARGQLPNLSALRARAVTARLATDYGAASPIVWTTVATGVNKEVHGITGFEVGTATGTVPVSSTIRKAAALWNMVSWSKRKVLALGWWGSWPAEEVNGKVVTDRSAKSITRRVHPPEWESEFLRELRGASRAQFPQEGDAGAEDRMVQHFLIAGLAQPADLTLAYFHGTDIVSHKYWKYYRPEGFKSVDPERLAQFSDKIPEKYRAVDAVIGQVLRALGDRGNLIVVSDHGFAPLAQETVRVQLDMELLLDRVGLTTGTGSAVDFARSVVYCHGSAPFQASKNLRFAMRDREPGGTVTPETAAAVRARVTDTLALVTYADGAPVFTVRDAHPGARRKGADFVVDVATTRASLQLRYRNQPLDGVVRMIVEHSGGHSNLPPGVFLAAGPDIDRTADLTGIRIHDITPTVLFGMGLPLAEDFAGRAWENLYTAAFRARHPRRTVATWGGGTGTTATDAGTTDVEMLEELRSLGYIE